MTKQEFLIKYPNCELVEFKEKLYLRSKRGCGHYDVFNLELNTYSEHSYLFQSIGFVKQLNKNDLFMIPTKENLINVYKNYPTMRQFLIDLYGNFIPENEMKIIELEEKNKLLEKQLENCDKIKNETTT
jgi:hypothetical protein